MINLLLTLLFVFLPLSGTDIDPRLIMERSYNLKKPMTSIMDIEIEIIRKKGKKEKVKIREFTRYQKLYDSGTYLSKTMARFTKPKIVKGTGLLTWVGRSVKRINGYFFQS